MININVLAQKGSQDVVVYGGVEITAMQCPKQFGCCPLYKRSHQTSGVLVSQPSTQMVPAV